MDSQQYNDMMMNKPEYITRIGGCLRLLQDEANNIKTTINNKLIELDNIKSILNNYCTINIKVNNVYFYANIQDFNDKNVNESTSTSVNNLLIKPINTETTFSNKMYLTYYNTINNNNMEYFVLNNYKELLTKTTTNSNNIESKLGIANFDNVTIKTLYENSNDPNKKLSDSIKLNDENISIPLNDTNINKVDVTIDKLIIYYTITPNRINI